MDMDEEFNSIEDPEAFWALLRSRGPAPPPRTAAMVEGLLEMERLRSTYTQIGAPVIAGTTTGTPAAASDNAGVVDRRSVEMILDDADAVTDDQEEAFWAAIRSRGRPAHRTTTMVRGLLDMDHPRSVNTQVGGSVPQMSVVDRERRQGALLGLPRDSVRSEVEPMTRQIDGGSIKPWSFQASFFRKDEMEVETLSSLDIWRKWFPNASLPVGKATPGYGSPTPFQIPFPLERNWHLCFEGVTNIHDFTSKAVEIDVTTDGRQRWVSLRLGKDEDTKSSILQQLLVNSWLDFLAWQEELVNDKKDIPVTDVLRREFMRRNESDFRSRHLTI